MTNAYDVIIRPVFTEKSMALTDKKEYVFEVSKKANKTHIKQAIESLYGVEVERVNVVNVKPRPRRVGRYQGYKRTFKKAYVKLTVDSKEIETFNMD